MAVSILGTITVHETIAHSGFSLATHSVTSGTDTLLAVYISRQHTAGIGIGFSATWAGNTLAEIRTNYPVSGQEDIIHWVGAINAPTTGAQTFTFDTNSEAQRGGRLVLLNLDGCDTIDLMGANTAQRAVTTAVDTVSLTITPETTGNLILAAYAISAPTTVVSFDPPTGYTPIGTDGQTSGGGGLTITTRYKPNATGAQTSGATFAVTDLDIGGLLMEIRQAGAAVVTDSLDFSTTPLLDSITGVASQAFAPSASWWHGRSAWTATVIYQADDVNVDRQILRIGSGADTRFAMTRKAVGSATNVSSVMAGEYLLTDGAVRLESFSAAQGVGPSIFSISQAPPDMYVNDIDKNPSFLNGGSFTGGLRLDSLPVEVGAHSGSTAFLPFVGKLARWIVDSRAWSFDQNRVLFRAFTESHLLWGQGAANLATDANKGPVALPIVHSMTGAGPLVITPPMIDPDGTVPAIIASSISTGGGTTSIVGLNIHYTPAASFIGRDFFNYTISDGLKTSTAWIAVDRLTSGLNAVNDSISLQENTSLTFDPRTNDTGAQGPVTIISFTQPSIGSVTLEPDGRLRFVAPIIT